MSTRGSERSGLPDVVISEERRSLLERERSLFAERLGPSSLGGILSKAAYTLDTYTANRFGVCVRMHVRVPANLFKGCVCVFFGRFRLHT